MRHRYLYSKCLWTNSCAVFIVNLLGVRVFGELEFWFSSIKGVCATLLQSTISLTRPWSYCLGRLTSYGHHHRFGWQSETRSYWIPILGTALRTNGKIPIKPSQKRQVGHLLGILEYLDQRPIRLYRYWVDRCMSYFASVVFWNCRLIVDSIRLPSVKLKTPEEIFPSLYEELSIVSSFSMYVVSNLPSRTTVCSSSPGGRCIRNRWESQDGLTSNKVLTFLSRPCCA